MAYSACKIYCLTLLSLLSCCLAETALKASFNNADEAKPASDLKTSASERLFDIGSRPSYIPATVYGAPGGGYNPTGYSGYNYNTGGYGGYNGYSGLSSPGYTGYSGYNGYSGSNGYIGNGYNNIGSGYAYSTYPGNGGYGGYSGNGGLTSYSGYNYPSYTGQGNLGYGYYRGGLGTGYRNRYGLTGYSSITPSYVSGYRGYTK